ncbi:MAG: rhodanese-like domain-containing protein [Phycisphaerales bacterium]|nr:rhodanese-like domain-containing protein [Phycisphaerales bacterium]
MKRTLLILALLILPACSQNITDSSVEETSLTFSQLRKLTENDKDKAKTLLIDARTPIEFAAGHIPGAVNISVAQVSGVEGATDARLLKFATLIVYGSNPSSITAKSLGKRLISTGYKDVRYYPDGFDGWKASGGRIEATPKP